MQAPFRLPQPEPRWDLRHPVLVVLASLVFGSLVIGVAAAQTPLHGVIALAAVTAAVWAVSHPTTGALAIVAIVPAISGFQRGLPVPGFRLGELLAVGFAVMLLTTAGAAQRPRWRAVDWLAFGYVVATLVLGFAASTLRGDSLSTDDVGQLVGPLQFFLLYRALLVALPQRRDRMRALDALLLGSLPVIILTLLQTVRIPGIHELLVALTGEDWSGREEWAVFRANGPFPHHTVLAGYLAAILIVCGALLFEGVRGRRRRLVQVVLGSGTASLVASLTYGPLLAVPVAVLLLAWWYRRTARAVAYASAVGLVLAVAFLPTLSGRADEQFATQASSADGYSVLPTTLVERVKIWEQQYLPALEGRWLVGYGPQVPTEIRWPYTESIYLTMLLRGGLPLLVLYLGLMAALVVLALDVNRGGGVARASPDLERALARALVVLIVVLAAMSLIAPHFTMSGGLPHVLWILAALVVLAAGRRATAY